MSFTNKPNFIRQAFASNGTKNNIPDTTLNEGFASFEKGFPDITMQPKESGGLPPRGQDMNGILNNGGSQFDIYSQMGGTYSLNTEILANGGYAKNSVVFEDDGVYRSLIDNNIDNFKTNPSVIGSTWQLIIDYSTSQGSNGVPGQLSYFARNDVPTGWLRCDGTQYTRSAFPQLFDNYLMPYKLSTCTYAEYYNEISTQGSCGKFALDEVNQLFKVPTILNNVFMSQALTNGGEFTGAGIPNITGSFGAMAYGGNSETGGCFADAGGSGSSVGSTGGAWQKYYGFDASNSSSVYGRSDTVMPNSIKYPFLVCVANLQVPVSEAQYNGFIDNLASKVNTSGDNAVFDSLSTTAKNNILAFTMALPVNTENTIGQIKFITSAIDGALSMPSGGTWAILSSFSANYTTAAVYDYGSDEPTSFVVAGGTQIRPGRSGYVQRAYVIRIQ